MRKYDKIKTDHPLYNKWKRMKKICYIPNCHGYLDGIKMCDDWLNDFNKFYDWGINKYFDKALLSRIDKTKDFSPDNCYFETCSNRSKNNQNISKMKDTMVEKYGNWYTKTDAHKESVKKTCNEKYGKDWVTQVDEFKEKAEVTNIKKYGYKKPSCNKLVKDKTKKTCLNKYGVDCPSKSDIIKEKIRNVCLEKYGKPYYCNTNLKTQNSIKLWLEENGYVFESNYSILDGKEIDLYNDELKFGIEYCGLYWHTENRVGKKYHYDKYKKAKDKNIRLITLFSDEWIDKNKQVKSFILSAIGKYSTKINGRECTVSIIENKLANSFLNEYHIQGCGRHHVICVGLFYKNELVGITTFNIHHRNNKDFILDRLVFKSGYRIIGGFSKMLKLAIKYCKENSIDKIITWSDNRISAGKVYESSGFILDKELNPDYSYCLLSNPKKRISKQSKTKKIINCPNDKSEYDYLLVLGYDRIWDCGKCRYIYYVDK